MTLEERELFLDSAMADIENHINDMRITLGELESLDMKEEDFESDFKQRLVELAEEYSFQAKAVKSTSLLIR